MMIKTNYVPNNVHFQLVASCAWSDFYKVREFLLNQLVISENRFSTSCKETFLYSMHQIRYWLIGLEEGIKSVKHTSHSDAELKEEIKRQVDYLDQYFDGILSVMRSHEDQFDEGFVEVYGKILLRYKDPISDRIRRLLRNDFNSCFNSVVSFCTQYITHLLHILYELDYLYWAKKERHTETETFYPFIGLDTVDVNLYKDRRISLIEARLKIYNTFGLLKPDAYWTVKSYFNKATLDNDFDTFKLFSKLLSDIELHDIRISCVM